MEEAAGIVTRPAVTLDGVFDCRVLRRIIARPAQLTLTMVDHLPLILTSDFGRRPGGELFASHQTSMSRSRRSMSGSGVKCT